LSELFIKLEQWTIQLNESFLDDWNVLIFTKFKIHHGDERIPSWKPFFRLLIKIANTTHHACLSGLNDGTSIQTQRVTVIAVKICWECASSFVTKVIGQRLEYTLERII